MTSQELIQKIREEIERRINSIVSCPFIEAEFGSYERREGKIQSYKEFLSFLDTLEVEELQEGLDEAAEEYAWKKEEPLADGERLSSAFKPRIVAFKDGADFGAKKMLAKLKENCVIIDKDLYKAEMEERFIKGRKEGIKWMAEQGWYEEAIIKGSDDVVWLNYNVELPVDLAKYFKDGDKVIVQIRKKD